MCNHTIKVRYQFSSTFTATWYQVKCKLTQNKNTTPPIGCCSSLLYAHMKFDHSLGTDYMELHPSQKVRHIWKTVWLISRMPNPLKNTIKRSKLEQKQPYTVREYVYKSINRHQHFADFSRRKSQSRINDKKTTPPTEKKWGKFLCRNILSKTKLFLFITGKPSESVAHFHKQKTKSTPTINTQTMRPTLVTAILIPAYPTQLFPLLLKAENHIKPGRGPANHQLAQALDSA